MAGNGTLKVVQMMELDNEGQYEPMVFRLQYVKWYRCLVLTPDLLIHSSLQDFKTSIPLGKRKPSEFSKQ